MQTKFEKKIHCRTTLSNYILHFCDFFGTANILNIAYGQNVINYI